jgi:hypothetical protein
LSTKEYMEAMMGKIDDVPKSQFKELHEIESEKMWMAKAYNKMVREKTFQIGDLVC